MNEKIPNKYESNFSKEMQDLDEESKQLKAVLEQFYSQYEKQISEAAGNISKIEQPIIDDLKEQFKENFPQKTLEAYLKNDPILQKAVENFKQTEDEEAFQAELTETAVFLRAKKQIIKPAIEEQMVNYHMDGPILEKYFKP